MLAFYNDSISPVTKISLLNPINSIWFYNDSISPVTKMPPGAGIAL